jgi:hypothetical protein
MSAKQPASEFIGKTYGYLTILEDLGNPVRDRAVLAKCICGIVKGYLLLNIKRGKSYSCGCYSVERLHERKTHGLIHHSL